MSFGGHAYDMNLRIQQNREMKQRRRERTTTNLLSVFEIRKNKIHLSNRTKEYPPEYRKEVLQRLKSIKRKEIRMQIIALIASSIFVFSAIFIVLKLYVFS